MTILIETCTSYSPFYLVTLSIQAVGNPFVEAYISVAILDMLYKSSEIRSGQLLGEFILVEPIILTEAEAEQGKSREVNLNDVQSKKQKGQRDSITSIDKIGPLGLSVTRGNQALIYKAVQLTNSQTGEELPILSAFSVVWKSPNPDLGAAVVIANIRRQNESKWTKLSYSLKESSQRIYNKPPEADMKSGKYSEKKALEDLALKQQSFKNAEQKFSSFNQNRHHELFWEYVRDKQWATLEGFLDHKSVVYYDSDRRVRPWRIVDLFRSLFGSTAGLVLACPFTYKPGLTRSRVVAEIDIARGVVKAVNRNQKPAPRVSSLALALLKKGGDDVKDDVLKDIEETKEEEDSQNSFDANSDCEDFSSKSKASKASNESTDQKDWKKEGVPRLDLGHTDEGVQRPETDPKLDHIAGNEELKTETQQHEAEEVSDHRDLEIMAVLSSMDSQENYQNDKELDEPKVLIIERSRSKPLQLPQVVFTEAVEGPAFIKTVKCLAKAEHDAIMNMRFNKLLEREEKRDSLMDPLKAR